MNKEEKEVLKELSALLKAQEELVEASEKLKMMLWDMLTLMEPNKSELH